MVRGVIFRSASRWPILALALICAIPGWAKPLSITVLTGTNVRCDSTGSGGHPTAIQWVVTRPDSLPPTKPTSTEPAFEFIVDFPGIWTIDLNLDYTHEVDGSPWSSQDQGVIEAKSVVADLEPGPLQVTTTQTITLDGSASQISGLTVASGVFMVDGIPIDGCDFPSPITDLATLNCVFPASDLGPGIFVVSLELTDSVGGSTDADQATLEIIEEPPFTVDFLPTFEVTFPLSVFVQLVLSDGWAFSDLQNAVWDFGDESPPENIDCPNDWTECEYWSHTYTADGFYDVTVTVTTTGGHWNSMTYEVTIGDPPPVPTADFTASPAESTVNTPVSFTFTGECTDICTYDWNFGDGSTSTLLNPTHSFVAPVDREVTLTVANGSGQDDANQIITVSNCWSPSGPIGQTGTCYGAPVTLSAPPADGFSWSTGATTSTITVAAPMTYWAHLRQGPDCWAYAEYTVSLQQCQGNPEGNVNMDGQGLVDAADLQALVRELSDGDGQRVIDSWDGELGAPGADLTGTTGPDGLITSDDLGHLLGVLFSGE